MAVDRNLKLKEPGTKYLSTEEGTNETGLPLVYVIEDGVQIGYFYRDDAGKTVWFDLRG